MKPVNFKYANLVFGKDLFHVCLYQNGELVHDPHPDNTGIKSEVEFTQIFKK